MQSAQIGTCMGRKMNNFTNYNSSYIQHVEILDYLESILGPLGFHLQIKGFANFTYEVSEYSGGPSREYESSLSFEDHVEYNEPVNVYLISEIVFVKPPVMVDVEFNFTPWNGELEACLNTKQIPTSKHRTGKIYWNEYVGKFSKSWYSKNKFESDFEIWFNENARKLLNLTRKD